MKTKEEKFPDLCKLRSPDKERTLLMRMKREGKKSFINVSCIWHGEGWLNRSFMIPFRAIIMDNELMDILKQWLRYGGRTLYENGDLRGGKMEPFQY